MEFKLQIGCLIVVIYFTVIYVIATTGKNRIRCHRLFDALLILCPWAIFFDGATAWTVNHMDIVPDIVNLILHGLFFLSMNLVIMVSFLYMFDQIVGIDWKKWGKWLLAPGVLTCALIVLFLPKLYYIQGETTNYSMGASVVICYLSLIVHFLFASVLMICKYKYVEARKRGSLISYVAISFVILIVQVVWTESLVSSILPMISVICMYENFENPYLRRIHAVHEEMITGFSTLVENRDDNTGGHIKRTREYVKIILKEMEKDSAYNSVLTRDYVRNVLNAAPLHDVGKIGTPDYILKKPGRLTAEEYEIMKQHAPVGGEIIRKTFTDLKEPEYLQIAYEVARFHHEKWNGKGYPEGLSGENIPLHARIMAIADVFDAVSAKRCYRDAMPIEECFKIIEDGCGSDFDPKLARIFLNARRKVLECFEANRT